MRSIWLMVRTELELWIILSSNNGNSKVAIDIEELAISVTFRSLNSSLSVTEFDVKLFMGLRDPMESILASP
jgi:hypothetical protein